LRSAALKAKGKGKERCGYCGFWVLGSGLRVSGLPTVSMAGLEDHS